jgi:protein TonB
MKTFNTIAVLLICLLSSGSMMAQSKNNVATKHEVDKMPEYPGGMTELVGYLGNTIKYPEGAKKAGAEATIFIKFVVDKKGKVTKVSSMSKEEDTREDMIMEAIRVIKSMPNWMPAEKDGKKVACEMVLPIKFKLN